MLNIITKYWALVFYLATLCIAYTALSNLGSVVAYAALGAGILVIMGNMRNTFSSSGIGKIPILLLFVMILISYQFSFGLFHSTEKSWSYFISKLVVCLAIASTLSTHIKFYQKSFLNLNACITAILLVFGFFIYKTGFGGRYTLGFGTSNGLGAVSAIAAGTLLISDKICKRFAFVSFVLCASAVLMSGSRVAVGMLFIATIIKFGLKIRTIAAITLAFLALNIIPSMLNIESVAMDRFSKSIQKGDFSSGRESEREATILMIKESPLAGNGLYAQQSERAKEISILGSHCGYLDLIKMLGIPLGGILVVSLIWQGLKLSIANINTCDSHQKQHLYVVIAVLIASFFEAYIWGVFQVTTTIFFISFATLQITSKHEK